MKNEWIVEGRIHSDARFKRLYDTKTGGKLLSFFLTVAFSNNQERTFNVKCTVVHPTKAVELEQKLAPGTHVIISGPFEIGRYKVKDTEEWKDSPQLIVKRCDLLLEQNLFTETPDHPRPGNPSASRADDDIPF